jgi:galactose-1-phosphate uridylyltransferase
MDAEIIRDRLVTARRWALAANDEDPTARYYFLIWNCLWRAGGSIVHGHMQMTVTRGMHYPRVELLRRRSLAYDEQHGRDYFDDLWLVHDALGLGLEHDGARVFASLAPVKESEVVILGRPGEDETALASAIARVIAAYRAQGVVSYNLALLVPPIVPDGNDWRRFPAHARLVDRGDPANKTSDIGGMELYAASVVAADPFRLAQLLRI